jgi:hypothetical protein
MEQGHCPAGKETYFQLAESQQDENALEFALLDRTYREKMPAS